MNLLLGCSPLERSQMRNQSRALSTVHSAAPARSHGLAVGVHVKEVE
jgi:hypothetical protein